MQPRIRLGLACALAILAISAFNPPGDVLVVLSLLAVLVLRELAGRGLDAGGRTRVDYVIGAGCLVFLVVVVKRVVDILAK